MVEANKKRIIEINQLSFSILHQFFKYENVDIYPRVSINSPLSFLSLSELRSSISASVKLIPLSPMQCLARCFSSTRSLSRFTYDNSI